MIKKIVGTFLLWLIAITAFSQTFVGDWKGDLQVGNSSLVFIIHLSQENVPTIFLIIICNKE